MTTTAVADFVGSALLMADTCTVPPGGTELGALYVPRLLIVPTVAFPPMMPFTAHFTDVSAAFCTVAVNVRVRFTRTVALVGEIVTVTGGGGFTTVTLAVPVTGGTVVLVATIVTAPDGTLEGAVYRPVESIAPAPLTLQVTT